MNSQDSENIKSSEKKLDEILATVKQLKNHIDTLDNRISHLEGHIDEKLSTSIDSSKSKVNEETVSQNDFSELDEHLKRTYQTLAGAKKPLTASEVAERMGRSRSTTSHHLNQLEKMGVLEKFPSPLRESSRNVLFRLKDSELEL